jgi:hypothetical protein
VCLEMLGERNESFVQNVNSCFKFVVLLLQICCQNLHVTEVLYICLFICVGLLFAVTFLFTD